MTYKLSVKVVKRRSDALAKSFGRGAVAGVETNISQLISTDGKIHLNKNRKPYDHILDLYHEVAHIVVHSLAATLQTKIPAAVEKEIVEGTEQLFKEALAKAGLNPLLRRLRYPK